MLLLRKILLIGVAYLVMTLSVPVATADLERGFAAYNRGDYATALKEWRPLAIAGDAGAQFNLGHMHREGKGTIQDYRQAFKWYKKAAEQGLAKAQNNLGAMYENGKGIPQNFVLAYMWYNIAAAGGHEKGNENRDYLLLRMSSAQVAEAQRLSHKCVAKNYKKCP